MALQQLYLYSRLGIEYKDSYVKITSFQVQETGKDETGKLYAVSIRVSRYTDNTKQYILEENEFQLSNLREENLSLSYYYSQIKEKLENSIDC